MGTVADAPTLVNILKNAKVVSEEALKQALAFEKTSGKKLIHILIEEGMISEKDLMFTLSTTLGIPTLNLFAFTIDTDIIRLIPKKIAERHEVVAVSQIGQTLTVAMSDPLDVVALDDIKKITNRTLRPVIASTRHIRMAIDTYYTEEMKLEEALKDLDPEALTVVGAEKKGEEAEVSYHVDQAPVIKMVNLVLQEAIKNRASDIHFEPFQDRLRVRFRIDGTLRETFSTPRDMYNSLLTRIKIISDLDITEKRLPQDGRFKAKFLDREIDFRVSVLPTNYGEKAVLRVLDKSALKTGLDQLGFSEENIKKFEVVIRKPYGIVLVTGPTGSGKSTTLYTLLNQLNTKQRNIMTVEDPIEYQLYGVTQTQVHGDIGLTFASGLRSILRQSPDVILVGEIRDSETADIAVKAALTGHLVFSTLHTNNAAGAVTRLIDMGVEAFLIASSLIAGTAQRLLRRMCQNCKETYELPQEVLARLPKTYQLGKETVAYRGKGCKQCGQSGYRGRLAITEILLVDEEIQQMIIDRKPTGDIEEAARKKGMKTLFENAMEGFQKGITPLEEVLRVTSSEEA